MPPQSKLPQISGPARIAIDIGGTFTDLCVVHSDGNIATAKTLTTPSDPSIGFAEVLDKVLDRVDPLSIRQIAHGTTIATNAILEGKTARLGMITTEGFRDVIEIGRHFRRELYNFRLEKPPALVPRERRLEVWERMDAQGNAVRALSEEQVEVAVNELVCQGVEAIVICFLHSYANPDHEVRAGEIAANLSGLPVVLSHEVYSAFREYERFSTAAITAGILPVVSKYLDRIVQALNQRRIPTPLTVMQSNGGMLPAALVRRAPATLVESGPAAGVIAAVEVGRRLDVQNLICFDMGGTTAKATLVRDGRITLNTEYEVGEGLQGGFGTGYPLRVPVVDLVEIGTGGGSIAYIDDAGGLHVGPKSAGADPGPACYGRGGRDPTVTDANLVLGRLRPDNFAGKAFSLNADAAFRAISQHIAQPLGIEAVEAAEGIIRIANAQMGEALKLVSVQRGYDPRDYALVAFGGAGPMHAVELAAELGCPKVVIPSEAGVQSAWGMLVADARYDFAQSIIAKTAELTPATVNRIFRSVADQGRSVLFESGFESDRIEEHLSVDARYVGQAYEVTVEMGRYEGPSDTIIREVNKAFHDAHRRTYGHSDTDGAVEWVTIRAAVIGRVERPAAREHTPSRIPLRERSVATQEMVWAGRGYRSSVYDRGELAPGDVFAGPAVILQDEATTCLPPNATASVHAGGDLIITVRGAANER